MGCTVREKHIRTSRRSRSMKPTNTDVDNHHHNHNHQSGVSDRTSALAKSMLESGFKPWTHNMGFNDSTQISASNPNDPNSCSTQNPGFDDCGWGYCTEEQLEEILLKQLEFLYNEAVAKLVALGYDEEVALKAVLRNGHCYGGMDVLTNILHNSLTYLNSGCCGNDEDIEVSELVFTDLRQLEEYSLAGMVCLLQQVRPHLSRGDAMWCLLMSDLHVGRASTLEIPMVPSPSNVCGSAMSNIESRSTNPSSSGISVPPGLCKFHGGWGFGNESNSELPVNGLGGFISYSEASIQREIDCAKRFNLSPSMKSLLKRNVAAFAAGFRSKQQLQMQSQPCISSTDGGDSSKETAPAGDVPSEPRAECNDSNQDIVNSLLNKFRDLNLDENLECVTEVQKDEIMLTLLHQVKDLEKQVNERKDWAHQKAMQAARKLSSDLTELKTLRADREETQRLKKGKQTLEDTTMKRLSEMENALRKASSQVDRANASVRRLEVENAEIRAEMEASKLSASESVTTCLEVAKREKKCLKRLLAWEKQKTKLQEEISTEKQKIDDLQQQLLLILASQKEAEAKWKREVKEKELAMTQVEEERRSKEATESNNKRKLEALRLRIDIDFQRNKDDLQRLEQELSRLKANAQLLEPQDSSDTFGTGSPEAGKQGENMERLVGELDEPDKEGSERECLICMKEEVSVVFLPCAHQIMCASCGEDYGKQGKATCPCCRCPIEQRIRVFGASS
ncbi:MND1-interacting protein 1 [Bienertia sinuspersici]